MLYLQETVEKLTALQDEVHMKNKECEDLRTHTTELTANLQTVCGEYESKICRYQRELEESKRQFTAEIEALKDSQQMSLTESQQEIENLQQEIHRLNRQYEDDVRELEEQLEMNAADFEKERERLLLLHDELSEQLALKEGFLQDVQEEEEDTTAAAARALQKDSGIAKTLDFPPSDDSSDEAAMLKSALEDLQSQTVMLQEELTFLRNVKLELESELKQVKDEFTVEKEELEFRIHELLMNKDEGDTSVDKTGEKFSMSLEHHYQNVQTLDVKSELDGSAEYQEEIHQIQTNQDVDVKKKAEHFVAQYQLTKRQTEASLQTLKEKLKSVFQERERLLEKLSNAEGMSELTAEYDNVSFEDVKKENEEILLQLQRKDTLVVEFKEMLDSRWNRKHQDCDSENQLWMITREKEERIKTLEEDVCALRSRDEERQESIKLLTSSGHQISEALSHIAEILKQKYSETEVDVTSDISTLIDHLVTKAEEEKSTLTRQFDHRAERFAIELEQARRLGEEQTTELQERLKDVSREKELLKASLHDMLLDTEALQKDLREIQTMNETLRGENQSLLTRITDGSRSLEEHASEINDVQVSDTTQLQQSVTEKDALISQMKEEIVHLQVIHSTFHLNALNICLFIIIIFCFTLKLNVRFDVNSILIYLFDFFFFPLKQTSVSDEDMKVISHKIGTSFSCEIIYYSLSFLTVNACFLLTFFN